MDQVAVVRQGELLPNFTKARHLRHEVGAVVGSGLDNAGASLLAGGLFHGGLQHVQISGIVEVGAQDGIHRREVQCVEEFLHSRRIGDVSP